MGRKSAASLSVLVPLTTHHKLPKPRAGLSLDAKALFAEIVASTPPDHFRESDSPLIEQYAVAILNARDAQKMVEKHGMVIGIRISPFAKTLHENQKMIVNIARSLRLSPQTRHDYRANALRAPASNDPRRPWLDATGDVDD